MHKRYNIWLFSSRFINSSAYHTAVIVIQYHGQELIHDLLQGFHLPAQSDSAVDSCLLLIVVIVHVCYFSESEKQMKSRRLTRLSIRVHQCHLLCLSSYHPFEWNVSSKTAHHMSNLSMIDDVALCICCWTQDFLKSSDHLHHWSPVIIYLVDLPINNTVSMLSSSFISSNLYFARLLQSKSRVVESIERDFTQLPRSDMSVPNKQSSLVFSTSCLLLALCRETALV